MFQQILALTIIAFFIARLFWQFKKTLLSKIEFRFWLFFWLLAACSIVLLPEIDRVAASLGFSASGIAILADLAIVLLFYLVFRLRLRVAKLERDITTIVEAIALKK